jgi:hypothetical protein
MVLAVIAWLVVVGGGSDARATLSDGDVQLGGEPAHRSCTFGAEINCEGQTTQIFASAGRGAMDGLNVLGINGGTGMEGDSDSGDGVLGSSSGGIGVAGQSDSNFGLYADSTNATGGHIQTESQFGAGLEVQISNAVNARGGIETQTSGAGQGLLAQAGFGAGVEGHSTNGPGVYGVADTSSATALKAKGKTALSGPTTLGGTSTFTGATTFARSGRLTIRARKAQATRMPISLGSKSSVLATIQGNQPGVYVQGVTTVTGPSGSFTIHLNKSTPVKLVVAWFVLS